MRTFVYTSHPSRVVFGSGAVDRLREEIERLGRQRILLLSGPALEWASARVREAAGDLVVAEFGDAAMHTPVEVTERALAILRETSADCLVAVGGGSTTGLSKALALRTGLPQVILPTTYAGSEVTPVLGETRDGHKTTRSSPEILPGTVLYDVDLTLTLPVPLSVTSGVNALAHAVEALYSADANPVTDGQALQAISLIGRALPRLAADPADREARADLLEAAWLAGTCLATVGMGLHHKLCHTLGGSFGLPHAPTHTVILPHAMAYNAPAAPEVMRRIAEALGVPDAPAGVHDLVTSLGGPVSLRELGMPESGLAHAAEWAAATPYPNPREVTAEGLAGLLSDAWHGRRPAGRPSGADPRLARLTEQVVASFAQAPEPRTGALLADLVRHLHSFVIDNDVTDSEWQYAIDFLTRTGQQSGPTRQEFVLLSDTLGVSSVVDLLTNSRTPGTTPSAVLGPFYVEGPPEVPHGSDISGGLDGTPLWVDVRVTDTAGKPLGDAVVDVWQSNEDGFYDVQLPDLDGPVLRARLRTDAEGRITFWSTLPAAYPIPDDGPVGQMLAAVGRHPYRAPHLHFMIGAHGHRRLVTQLFVAGGAYLDGDTVFGVKDELVVDYTPQSGPTPDGRRVDGPWRRLSHTFRIAPSAE
ncbi:maleylacetate reductase and hydroxyquinol 1,2-dioxygenase domain-containing protein [Streptomyces glomeratus]|uniref:Maleylacetate reductase and hydroxyquinol 1,2-dioxygenase domain-containing protein n=1 Tax=Streptomyces glomeratus TaxID=284452 RepID=A0ABN3YDN5_9ACTN|nr:maleylacetate reductase and hydroxyquinol 1,2-dioxygenase domain-containing protein [Streptomyces glomeratus]MCF1509062.1 maleylacetate reductase and hydroxyquinol 1,2-dioxygenase domain-containing protein [Streptomyces glomeratus]